MTDKKYLHQNMAAWRLFIITHIYLLNVCLSDITSNNVHVNILHNLLSDMTSYSTDKIGYISDELDRLGSRPTGIKVLNILTSINELYRGPASNAFSSVPQNLNVSEACTAQLMESFSALLQGETWPLQMLDAFGKPPSDLLDFRLSWYGSFDECARIQKTSSMHGQYCTVVFPTVGGTAEKIFPVLRSPIMRVSGKLPGLSLGVCVPSSCNEDDVTNVFNIGMLKLKSLLPSSNISVFASGAICQKEHLPLDTKAIAVLVVFVCMLILITIATVYDIITSQARQPRPSAVCIEPREDEFTVKVSEESTPLLHSTNNQRRENSRTDTGVLTGLLTAFSVYTNAQKIMNTKTPEGSLTAINGLRFLSITWVILGHTFAFGIAYGDNSSTFLVEMVFREPYHAVLRGFLAVDTFFSISGVLIGYLVMKQLEKTRGKLNFAKYYIHRLWRLTPPYMLLMMVYVPLFPYLLDGPRWPQTGMENNACRDTWWTNLLYVNNLVYTDKQCMAWCWYLANEMQFYLISPIILIPLYLSPAIGITICTVLLLLSSLITGIISSTNNMPPSMFGGGGDSGSSQSYLEDYYIKPYCRIGPYLIGILTGYLLHKTDCRIRINRFLNIFIWAVAFGMGCLIVYGLYDPLNHTPLTSQVAALYNATHRVLWGACVCWVIFACATGNGGVVNKILSWPVLTPLSRLTYCTYLIHPIIMFALYGSLRVPLYYSDFSATNMFLGNVIMAFMAGFVISLLFESPMLALEKVLFKVSR